MVGGPLHQLDSSQEAERGLVLICTGLAISGRSSLGWKFSCRRTQFHGLLYRLLRLSTQCREKSQEKQEDLVHSKLRREMA